MADSDASNASGGEERRQRTDRRQGDRRKSVIDRRSGLDRRRGAGRRRTDARRSAEEGEMTDEQFVFINALNEYKKLNNTPFPTWTEVLDVVKYLGYRKVAEVGEYSLTPSRSDDDGDGDDE